MKLTCWILLVVFGLLALDNIVKYVVKGITRAELVTMIVSIIIAAVAAGQIF